MSQPELALEQYEEEFDFFRTKQKIIQTNDFKKEPKSDDKKQNSPKILVLKLLLILIMPGVMFSAIYTGTYLADTLWEKLNVTERLQANQLSLK
jgi:hypothetical protein